MKSLGSHRRCTAPWDIVRRRGEARRRVVVQLWQQSWNDQRPGRLLSRRPCAAAASVRAALLRCRHRGAAAALGSAASPSLCLLCSLAALLCCLADAPDEPACGACCVNDQNRCWRCQNEYQCAAFRMRRAANSASASTSRGLLVSHTPLAVCGTAIAEEPSTPALRSERCVRPRHAGTRKRKSKRALLRQHAVASISQQKGCPRGGKR